MQVIELLNKIANQSIPEKATIQWEDDLLIYQNGAFQYQEKSQKPMDQRLTENYLNTKVKCIMPEKTRYLLKMAHSEFYVAYNTVTKNICFFKNIDDLTPDEGYLVRFTEDEINRWGVLKPYRFAEWIESSDYMYLKMIDVFNEIVNDEIKSDINIIKGKESIHMSWLQLKTFLTKDIAYTEPDATQYLIQVSIRGFKDNTNYLNYDRLNDAIFIDKLNESNQRQSVFNAEDLKNIEPVKTFISDMDDKVILIEKK